MMSFNEFCVAKIGEEKWANFLLIKTTIIELKKGGEDPGEILLNHPFYMGIAQREKSLYKDFLKKFILI
jgi:hypothetical protein